MADCPSKYVKYAHTYTLEQFLILLNPNNPLNVIENQRKAQVNYKIAFFSQLDNSFVSLIPLCLLASGNLVMLK